MTDVQAVALVIHRSDCGIDCVDYVEEHDKRAAQAVLESDWFKERLVKEWKYGYDRALLDERLRKSSGW